MDPAGWNGELRATALDLHRERSEMNVDMERRDGAERIPGVRRGCPPDVPDGAHGRRPRPGLPVGGEILRQQRVGVPKIVELLMQGFVQQVLGHPPGVGEHLPVEEDGPGQPELGARSLPLPAPDVGDDDGQVGVAEHAPGQVGHEDAEQLGAKGDPGGIGSRRDAQRLAVRSRVAKRR